MTPVDIIIFLAFGPSVLALVVVPLVVFVGTLALDTHDTYNTLGIARRAVLTPTIRPTIQFKGTITHERPWERNVPAALRAYDTDELNTEALRIYNETMDETVFSVDTKGITTIIDAAHRFATRGPLRVIPETEGTDSCESMSVEVFDDMVSREHKVWPSIHA